MKIPENCSECGESMTGFSFVKTCCANGEMKILPKDYDIRIPDWCPKYYDLKTKEE